MDVLYLPGWTTQKLSLDEDGYLFESEYSEKAEACPKCGAIGRLYRHGRKSVTYRDSPLRGRKVRISVSVRRYRCRSCGETFLQELKGIAAGSRMTSRCFEYIQEQGLRDLFAQVAGDVGCDEKTVRNIASEYIGQLSRIYAPFLPEWLGIDDAVISGQLRYVLTDVGERTLIEILPNRHKRSLTTWIRQFADLSTVRGVFMPTRQPYDEIADELFPDLPLDTVSLPNHGLKKKLRLELNSGTGKQEIASERKTVESSRNISEFECRQAARALYARRDLISRADFKMIGDGHTEAMKVIAKIINRTGRGYSFEVLRARALFGQMQHLPHPFSPVWSFSQTDRIQPIHTLQNTFLRKHLLRLLQNSCMSCRGVFHPSQLLVSRLEALSKADPGVNVALLCRMCTQRFDTERPESRGLLLGTPLRSLFANPARVDS